LAQNDTIIALFDDHSSAEEAVQKLMKSGFDAKSLSIVGKGFHSEETAIGFYNAGDRITFWGTRGAFWGGFWGLFFGGAMLTIPTVGPVVVVGYLTATLIAMVEGAALVGGISALGAALASIGIPKDSIVAYERAVKTDGFMVMAQGSAADVTRAKAILEGGKATTTTVHAGTSSTVPGPSPALVGA